MSLRLLIVTSTFPRWIDDADPPFVYELSRRLTHAFDITVHTPHYPGAGTTEIMNGIHVHRFRYFFSPFEKLAGSTGMLPTLRNNKFYYIVVPFFLLAQFFSLLLLVRRTRPDVIHAHWLFPQGFFAVIVKKIFKVPVMVTGHGADIFGLRSSIFKKIKQFTMHHADGVTVVSRALRNAVTPFLPAGTRIDIIPMGVDGMRFMPNKNDRSVREKYAVTDSFLLYVGRLTEKKGVRYLIDAMVTVSEHYPLVKLLIIGDGELMASLERRVRDLALERQVIFAGSIPNRELSTYYASADIFIGPSIQTEDGDNEGFGLTFVEASMSECLVIGTDAGGIGDIIQDGITGLLVPQKDSGALAGKIIYALKHGEEMKRIAHNGRNRCVRFYHWPNIAARYKRLLKQIAV